MACEMEIGEPQTLAADCRVGIAQVDAEHEQLFAIIQRVEDALGCDGDLVQVLAFAAVQELIDYTRTHFASEERLMRQASYPQLEAHIRLHTVLLQAVDEMLLRIEVGDPSACLELSRFLFSWLIDHILLEDRAFAAFYRQGAQAVTVAG
jgi:hemerythrin